MTHRPLIVQLFNGRGGSSKIEPQQDSTPDHMREQRVLNDAGFDVETVSPFAWPWNPAANKHNAFRGLDPLRALRILLTRRKAALICAHVESGVLILLLRRIFRFRPPVVIWEVQWSPGWAYREIINRFAIPRADCAVVFGSNQLSLLRDTYGISTRATLIPFCIDVNFFHPQPKSGNEAPYILSCGLDVGRDFDVFLDVSKEISAPFKIKDGKSEAISKKEYPNTSRVTGHLSYTKYRNLYVGASIVVVTTKNTLNASGVTSLMEAMSMGKPTIVSDNPALRDYLPPRRWRDRACWR